MIYTNIGEACVKNIFNHTYSSIGFFHQHFYARLATPLHAALHTIEALSLVPSEVLLSLDGLLHRDKVKLKIAGKGFLTSLVYTISLPIFGVVGVVSPTYASKKLTSLNNGLNSDLIRLEHDWKDIKKDYSPLSGEIAAINGLINIFLVSFVHAPLCAMNKLLELNSISTIRDKTKAILSYLRTAYILEVVSMTLLLPKEYKQTLYQPSTL